MKIIVRATRRTPEGNVIVTVVDDRGVLHRVALPWHLTAHIEQIERSVVDILNRRGHRWPKPGT